MGSVRVMKKSIVPGAREQAEFLCDVSGKPAVARLVLKFGYGSDHDGQMLDADLSCEVAEEVLALLRSKYPQFELVNYFLGEATAS